MRKNKIHFTLFFILILMFATGMNVNAQNSMVGDGFGGRLWYKPYNYTVGSYSAYTICGDSMQLYGWGDNGYYQLGDATKTSTSKPVRAKGMDSVKYYSTGYLMAAIRQNNSGWIWGTKTSGVPTMVISNVKYVDAGLDLAVFVKNDGTVWSVGSNRSWAFGNNQVDYNHTNTPQQMSGISNAVRSSNGLYNNLILLDDSTVKVTGTNAFGVLGTDSPAYAIAKTAVVIPKLSKIIDIKSATYNHIALDDSGNVYGWGAGNYGCLGNGDSVDCYSPKKIKSLKNIVAISGCNDGYHFLALDSGHNCYAWGMYNFVIGKFIRTPKLVATDVADIMAGERFSYIIKTDGSLWASGYSKGGSIWLNLKDSLRQEFTETDPTGSPFNLCLPTSKCQKTIIRKKTICEGDSCMIGPKKYGSSGLYTESLFKTDKCDSVNMVRLAVLKKQMPPLAIPVCRGETVQTGTKIYTDTGTYLDTFKNYIGCDSICTTIIYFKPSSEYTKYYYICKGESVNVGIHIYTDTGKYNDTIKAYKGCDSVIHSIIQYQAASSKYLNFSICRGSYVRIGSRSYSEEGSYYDTLKNYRGCDSIINSDIRFLPLPIRSQYFTICKGETVAAGQHRYRDSGNFLDTISKINSCDTILHTFISFKPDHSSTQTFNICKGETVKVGAHEYKEAGTYFDTMDNPNGCDSIITTIIITGCDYKLFNVFTPDKDNINDVFEIVGPDNLSYDLIIYNRWGVPVYQTMNALIMDKTNFWNGRLMNTGKECPSGTYYYIFEPKGLAKNRVNGVVELIR